MITDGLSGAVDIAVSAAATQQHHCQLVVACRCYSFDRFLVRRPVLTLVLFLVLVNRYNHITESST